MPARHRGRIPCSTSCRDMLEPRSSVCELWNQGKKSPTAYYCDGGLIFLDWATTRAKNFSPLHFALFEQFEEGFVFAQVAFFAQVAVEARAFVAIFVDANGILFLEGFVAFV